MGLSDERSTPLAEHLKQLQESVRMACEQFRKNATLQIDTKALLGPLIEAQERTRESLRKAVQAQRLQATRFIEPFRVPEAFAVDLSRLVQPAFDLRAQFEEALKPAISAAIETFKVLPELTREALLVLGKHGWFIDIEIPFSSIWALENALKEGRIEDAEEALVKYYRERCPEIAESLKKAYPHRAAIIGAAFDAHARAEYVLSIPVFLAQADGICQELIKIQLYKKERNGRPATSVYVEAIAIDTFEAALLSPLTQPLPISASAHQRADDFSELNRHQILHGESTDYGTEVNSLKAISLLSYVGHILQPSNDSKEEP